MNKMKKIALMAAAVMSALCVNAQTVSYTTVETRNAKKVVAKTETGQRDTYTRTTTGNLSYEQKHAQVFGGQQTAFDPTFTDVNGRLREGWTIGVAGLGLYQFGEADGILGGGGALIGYEWRGLLAEVEGQVVCGNKYPDNNLTGDGKYTSYSFWVSAGWKVWQSRTYANYIALKGGVGYSLQATDRSNSNLYSENYGFGVRASVRAAFTVGKKVQLFVEPGYVALPQAKHQGGKQKFRHNASLQAGLIVPLGR